MRASRRDHLVETALRLFLRDGFHATGIDSILAEADCAKMTLYNHFSSKEELILEALRRRDEAWRAWFAAAVQRRAASPKKRLLAIFGALREWFAGDFYGCAFINASAEYSSRDDPVHRVSIEHKRRVRRYVRDLAAATGAGDPDGLADQLCLLIEGAIVLAQVTGDTSHARKARQAAEILIDAALRKRGAPRRASGSGHARSTRAGSAP